ncbi:hypothetical protein Senen11_01141 [Salmonella enterica subsp. enterica]|nr:hypothetical protein C7442_11087 [Salmonella enterica]SUH60874.1 Uncharacterised protein [Salmonella enterica subsp. enterica serovar Choleraesuis]
MIENNTIPGPLFWQKKHKMAIRFSRTILSVF